MAYQERVGKEEGEFETRKIIKKKKKHHERWMLKSCNKKKSTKYRLRQIEEEKLIRKRRLDDINKTRKKQEVSTN